MTEPPKTRAECVAWMTEGGMLHLWTRWTQSIIAHLSADEERLKVVYGQLEEAITDTRSIIAQRDKALADLAVAREALRRAQWALNKDHPARREIDDALAKITLEDKP